MHGKTKGHTLTMTSYYPFYDHLLYVLFLHYSQHTRLIQKSFAPNNSLKYANFANISDFMKMSATCSFVLQYAI